MQRILLVLVILSSVIGNNCASAQMQSSLGANYAPFKYSCTLPFTDSFEIIVDDATSNGMDTAKAYINFGDGTDTTMWLRSSPGVYYYLMVHTYTTPGLFFPTAIFTDTVNMATDTFKGVDYNFGYDLSNSCATVTGNFYFDYNTNCFRDAGEHFQLGTGWYAAISFSLFPNHNFNDVLIFADTTGKYTVQLPPGHSYVITPQYFSDSTSSSQMFVPVSCSSADTVNVATTTIYSNVDFAYQCDTSGLIDVYAYTYTPDFRPGYQKLMYAYAGSVSKLCDTVTATITLTLDSKLTYNGVYYGMAPNSVSGNTLTWNVNSVNGLSDFVYSLLVTCDSSAQIGDSICNTISVSATNYTDTDLNNNTYYSCSHVTNSYDPNSKVVLPIGSGVQGLIAAGTNLNYLINFQNTGNDTAINIVVTDTLDANLDTNTLQLLDYSFPVTMTRTGRVLTFTFSNIMLPDSLVNESASNGYFVFSIKTKRSLLINTAIRNKAYIYFDNNPPVVTNSTLNTIQSTTGLSRETKILKETLVYPNPTNDEIFVKAPDNTNFSATMYDLLGHVISVKQSTNAKLEMSTRNIPAGLYLIRLYFPEDGSIKTCKVNIQH